MPSAEVLERVREALKAHRDGITGMVLPTGRIELTVSDAVRHVWSPQLTVDVEAADERSSRLHARFGPHPHVWTLYVALYAVSVIFAIACAVVGASQLTLGMRPYALYLTPFAVILAALVYGASYVGQGLGSAQMYSVRAFLEDSLGISVPALRT
ncbi:MAG: hypothetical protein KDC95_16585 [Planctomycetes bacterium]|nr:hypothetical protein [Planctomycetota bacterium]